MGHPAATQNQSTLGAALEGGAEGIWDNLTSIPNLLRTLADPQKRSALKQAFDVPTPQGKQRVLTTIGELVGGMGGAAAGGGWMSVPAAGAGAVLGKLAAQQVGSLLGLPQDWENQTGAETARDLSRTFTGNATGEGIGRVALPAVKTGIANVAKTPFQPTAAAAATNATADALGVPLTLAARTGSPRLAQLQAALSQHFAAGPVFQRANQEGIQALEGSFDSLFGRVNPTAVSREELADMLQQALAKARQSANDKITGQLDAISNSLAPAAKPAQDVGRGLQAGLAANTKRLSDFANKSYAKLDKMGENVMVPFDSVVDTAERMLADHPDLVHYLPSDVRGLLQKTAALRKGASKDLQDLSIAQAGAPYAELDPARRAQIDAIAQKLGIDTNIPTGVEVPYPTAQRIKSQLGDMRAGLGVLDNPAKKHAFAAIANEADDVLRTKIPDPALQDAYNEVTQKFAKGAQATREPLIPGKPGNPMAKTIREAPAPEDIANRLTTPYGATEVEQARTATSPQSMAHLEPGTIPPDAAEPLADVQRYAVDNMRQRATVPTPGGGTRVSPTRLRDQSHGIGAADTNSELLGPRFEDPSATGPRLSMGEVTSPEAVATEQSLYDSPLARRLDDPLDRANQVFGTALPPRAAGAAQATMDLAGPLGHPAARRALADDLLLQSQRAAGAKSAGFSDRTVLDPAALKKKIADYGETLDTVLEPDTLQGIQDRVAVGQAMDAPERLYGNTSRTAPIHQIMRGVSKAGAGAGALFAGGGQLMHHPAAVAAGASAAAGAVGLPWLLAKGMTSDKLAKGLTAPLGSMTITDAPVSALGTAFRVPYALNIQSNEAPAQSAGSPLKFDANGDLVGQEYTVPPAKALRLDENGDLIQ